MATDYTRLREHLVAQFSCDPASVHGPAHWKRVEFHGLLIAPTNSAIVEVIRLFALFHDCRRIHDGYDDGHGARGAEYASQLRDKYFELPDDEFELLHNACTWHAHGRLSDDPTIGACWDADRLDLGRVGMRPLPDYMSTPKGRELAGENT